MAKYVYQFDDSALKRLAENFESRVGDSSGSHEEDYFDMLRLLLSINSQGTFLDIGAGVGRVTAIARDIVAEIVALEPDEYRWSECHKAYHQVPQCQVLCQTTSEYIGDNPGKVFDLAVIGMVLQHISTGATLKLLAETATLLKPGGLALIYTTHSLEETRGFSFSGNSGEAYVSEEEFDRYAEDDPSQQTMGLPVRRFSKSELIDALPAQLQPIYWRQTSYYSKAGLTFFSSRLNVEPEKLKDIGNNQFVVVQKQP